MAKMLPVDVMTGLALVGNVKIPTPVATVGVRALPPSLKTMPAKVLLPTKVNCEPLTRVTTLLAAI